MLDNDAGYEYKTTHKGPFVISLCWNNVKVTLKCGAKKVRYNIRRINPYTSDRNVEDKFEN